MDESDFPEGCTTLAGGATDLFRQHKGLKLFNTSGTLAATPSPTARLARTKPFHLLNRYNVTPNTVDNEMNKATGKLAGSVAPKKPPAATIANEPFYYDANHELHYPALESTHRTFIDTGVSHIWACCRCTSRNVNDFRKCGGGGCPHRRCERDCRWLVIKGPVFAKQNANNAAPTGASSSLPSKHVGGRGCGVECAVQLPTPPSEVIIAE